MKRFVALLAVLLVGLCSVALSQNRSYTVDDLLKDSIHGEKVRSYKLEVRSRAWRMPKSAGLLQQALNFQLLTFHF